MINADKPGRWNEDTQASIERYNAWFLDYVCIDDVRRVLEDTDYLRALDARYLWSNPRDLAILRMFCSPPAARDRLAGLAHVSRSVVQSMERGLVAKDAARWLTRRYATNRRSGSSACWTRIARHAATGRRPTRSCRRLTWSAARSAITGTCACTKTPLTHRTAG